MCGERALHIALDSWALSAVVVPAPSLDLELISNTYERVKVFSFEAQQHFGL